MLEDEIILCISVTGFREQNAKMVPLMLQRLHKLQEKMQEDRQLAANSRPFAHFGQDRNSGGDGENKGVPGKRKVKLINSFFWLF